MSFLFKLVLIGLLWAACNCFRIKRSDIDLQTCIDNFNVHKDKIIRTQDSQNMGAKYLNEIDLGSREECLRLCCETEHCDVFVFEERNAGSCYLFHCGPSEDFKCKFTHHVNYSSGILAINRHLNDLESQIKLTKHEQDLNKLRKPDVKPDLSPLTTPSTTTTTATNKEVIPIALMKTINSLSSSLNSADEVPHKCSHVQFQCRSTGECIAIYNACDGIPQCADGSDEAAELHCPDITTMASNPIVQQRLFNNNFQQLPPQSAQIIQEQPKQQSYYDPLIGHQDNQPQITQLFPQQPQIVPKANSIAQQKVLQPLPKNYIAPSELDYRSNNLDQLTGAGVKYGNSVYDPAINYVPQNVLSQSNWMPHQSNLQMPSNSLSQQYDKNSHIFNHKENGLQVPDGQEISSKLQQPASYDTGSIRNFEKLPDVYKYEQPLIQQPAAQQTWINNNNNDAYNNKYNMEKVVQEEMMGKVDKSMQAAAAPAAPPVQATQVDTVENPKHVQEKLAHDLKHSKDNMDHGVEEVAKIKIEKHHNSINHKNNNNNNMQYPDVVAYKMDSNDMHDGISQTPRGAVLSLTLGLIITCIMAVLIGCRLKVVRRRMRRGGGKSYAHDADYLVNGMYL